MTPLCGIRYRCAACTNFNLCSICFTYDGVTHDETHPMEAIKRPRVEHQDNGVMSVEETSLYVAPQRPTNAFTFTPYAGTFK